MTDLRKMTGKERLLKEYDKLIFTRSINSINEYKLEYKDGMLLPNGHSIVNLDNCDKKTNYHIRLNSKEIKLPLYIRTYVFVNMPAQLPHKYSSICLMHPNKSLFISVSQNLSTSHPASVRASLTSLSRSTLRASFFCQYALLLATCSPGQS